MFLFKVNLPFFVKKKKKERKKMLPVHLCFCGGEGPERNFQADEVQIQEKTQASSFCFLFFLSSSARKSEKQKFLSCYGTRTRISTQILDLVKERK